jgi:diguanylate cyclase (GGDEF)-like protein/PAS domain S-box-containing protein
MNPAYALREMQNNFGNFYGIRSHITSLNPLNPHNAADAWETGALKRFEQGSKEITELQQIDGQPYLRVMRPFVVESDCLKCHAHQGYKVGDIRGGIGTDVLLTAYLADERKRNNATVLSHGMIWLIGLIGLFFSYHRERRLDNERNQAETDLRESEGRFRTIADAAPVLIWMSGTDKLCNFFNKGWLQFTGRSMEQEAGNGWSEGVHPDDLKGCFDTYVSAFDARQEFRMEYRLRRHDGEYRWIEDYGVPRFDGDGIFVGYIGNCTDITERKQAETALLKSESRFRTMFENNASVMLLIEPDSGAIVGANAAAARFYGYTIEHLQTMSIDQINTLAPAQAAAEQGCESRMERNAFIFPHRLASGEIRTVEVHSTPISLGESVLLFSIINDITERHQLEKSILESESKLRLLMNSAAEAIYGIDTNGNCPFCNPACLHMLGYQHADELIGKNMHDLIHYQHANGIAFPVEDCRIYRAFLTGETSHADDEVLWRADGTCFPAEYWSYPQIIDDKVVGAVVTFLDITDRKKSEETIWKQANFDVLTGLPNRHMFYDRLELELKKIQRTKLPLALMLIDLDHFKEVNDTLGHDMGDLLLVEAARRINECVRITDTVARLGGDEFVVILPELEDIGSAERIAQSIVQKISAPYQLKGEAGYVSASIGITLCPNDSDTIDGLLKNADQAMYAAKNRGRNCHNFFTPLMQKNVQTRQRLINDLRGALVAGQLMVYFQPIVELATGNLNKMEALIRWQHPERGLVSPAEFIPLAEETGLIFEIGDWVFHESMRWVKRWRAMYNPLLQISVNKSPLQFYKDGDEHSEWLAHLHNLGLPGQCVAIEITEGLLLDPNIPITETLRTLRNSDIQVSIDDFGTGYSSLSISRNSILIS